MRKCTKVIYTTSPVGRSSSSDIPSASITGLPLTWDRTSMTMGVILFLSYSRVPTLTVHPTEIDILKLLRSGMPLATSSIGWRYLLKGHGPFSSVPASIVNGGFGLITIYGDPYAISISSITINVLTLQMVVV